MSEIEWLENEAVAIDTVVRTWLRFFDITTDMEPMRHGGAKHKRFTPRHVRLTFTRQDSAEPVVTKVTLSGPFTSALGMGQRSFNGREYSSSPDLSDQLREKIDDYVAQVVGLPPKENVFTKMARRANGAYAEPFTPEEEELWQTFMKMRGSS